MEEGIVIELQKQALDENTSLESMLRKAYLVAKKLKLKDFEEWITHEQDGYSSDVPNYRILMGEMKAWNPYNGWIPIVVPADIANLLSRRPLGMAVSSIIDMYGSGEGNIILAVNGEMTDILNQLGNFPTKYGFVVSRSELYRIMSTVRNKILDWAILLEENGILGKGMTFTEEEKKVATSNSTIINYTNNFYAGVKDIDIQQGS